MPYRFFSFWLTSLCMTVSRKKDRKVFWCRLSLCCETSMLPSRQSLKEPKCGNSGTDHAYSAGVEFLSWGTLFYPLLPSSVLSTLVFFSVSALSPVSRQSGSLCRDKTSIPFYSILFYSILFYSILFYSILFYPILSYPIQSNPTLGTGHNTILLLRGWIMSSTLRSHGLQHVRLPCPSVTSHFLHFPQSHPPINQSNFLYPLQNVEVLIPQRLLSAPNCWGSSPGGGSWQYSLGTEYP